MTATPLHAETTDEHLLLTESAHAFCQKAMPLGRLRALRGTTLGFDRAMWAQMADLGWTGMTIPESAGGLGLDLSAMASVVTELGRVAAPEPLCEVTGLSGGLLTHLPRVEQVGTLLERIASGEALIIVAWQEDPVDRVSTTLTTRAVRTVEGFRLSGKKYCVPHAAAADGFLVTANLEDNTTIFWVSREVAGITQSSHPLADGTHHAILEFVDVSLPQAALLGCGVEAAASLAVALDEGAVLAAAYLTGAMAACFELTLKYLNTRQQFGRTIGGFQALQHRMVDLYLQREMAQTIVTDAARELAGCADPRKRAILTSRAKYRASSAALIIARESVQLHGAIGFTDECDVALYLGRSLVYSAALGNATWHCRRIAEFESERGVREAAMNAVPAPPREADLNELDDETFRHVVRQWFEKNYPPALRYFPRRVRWAEIKEWYLKLSAHGWVAPAWPRQFGGMGLDPGKLLIFIEEQERWGVARAPDMGIIMVGPLLIRHGSPTQHAYYLPKILAGDQIWCQGYSEPNAGSDLASLRTEAVLEGDTFVVNGQKTWTTLAQDATHIFVLTRTDKAAKKQAGISFLLVDMKTPGITVRPIKTIAGHEDFCEVFFDDVRVPKDNVVGKLNHGWTIAKALLGFERIFLGSPKQCQYALQRLDEVAHELGLVGDAAFRERFTQLKCDVLDLETIYERFAGQVKRGEPLGADVSLLKIWATETYAKLTELLLECMGSSGAQINKLAVGSIQVDPMSLFYNSRPARIYGGSNEIQRNILAKSVLGLPD
ncbi:MAG: acyl-CoA dehydrogenase [Gammaproteobacteria bacterium]|nr:acyl-CoA dehydrogenase [Gammaproteobacteria bacterium]